MRSFGKGGERVNQREKQRETDGKFFHSLPPPTTIIHHLFLVDCTTYTKIRTYAHTLKTSSSRLFTADQGQGRGNGREEEKKRV